jgi:hypothetical protein
MKKYIFSNALVVFGVLTTFAQIGIGTTSPNVNAALDVTSTSQGMLFPRMTTTQRDAINSPAKGLTIYNTTLNSVQTNTGTAESPIWKIWDGRNPATNGTADVSGYTCATATAGTLSAGVAIVEGTVTQTITATVTRTGTYTITASANGVIFTKSGTFSTTGAQNIILQASGTPTNTGTNIFTINTTPNCSFSRTTITVPDAPTSPVATPGNAQASIAFTAPASNGGSAITGYTVTSSPGSFTATATSSPIVVTGLTNGTTYTFTVVATNVVGNSVASTPSVAVIPVASLPANITLSAISPYFVASVNDQDYLPYTAPSVAASLTTGQPANGSNETITINTQGTLTTGGVTIRIPYTVVTASVNLSAFSQTINVPTSYTEDGIARDVTLAYSATTLAVGSGMINATLKAIGGALNVKKLDIQTGIGNDNLGWLLAQFTYATNSSGGSANFQFRSIAAIPDRNIANANHVMFYLPVLGADGKTWLNNNLGAHYANTSMASFNPAAQATSSTDWKAYGSLFQWGRYSDGHELVNYSSSSAGSFVNASNIGTSSSTTPGSNFLSGSANWYTGSNPNNLWQGVSGTNNPCPIGYRLPTETELNNQRLSWASNNSVGAFASPLKLPMGGYRNTSGSLTTVGTYGDCWSSTIISNSSRDLYFDSSASMGTGGRANGVSVRCIKD